MGKRELVLIVVFVVLGIGIYQLTAPPSAPGAPSASLSSIVENLRRSIHGAHEQASADSRQVVPVESGVTSLRLNLARPNDITVTGEDRTDIAVSLHSEGRGYDLAEAKASAEAVRVKFERIADAVVMTLDVTRLNALPRHVPLGQVALTLAVPRRLSLRMEPHVGRLSVTGLAAAEIVSSRGDTKLSAIAGHVQVTQSVGSLAIDGAGSVKLNTRASRSTVKHVDGAVAIDGIGGDVGISDVVGPLEIEGRNTDVRLDAATLVKGPLRVNTTGGDIRVAGLRTEARLDGRNSVIDVILAAAAPVTIYNLGQIQVTAPSGGYTLDAGTTEGGLTTEAGAVAPSEGSDAHAAGPVRGGGPTLTLRATRGGIIVRKAAAGK
jgi:hypothetical protein